MNADNNNPDTASGGAVSGEKKGEYLGYAGMGYYGEGIKPPKIGIEFDTYHNDSRNDNKNENHAAVIFWGFRNDTGYADDNIHGAGGGVEGPINPVFNSNAGTAIRNKGYHKGDLGNGYSCNWMEDALVHTVRVEVYRNTTTLKYEIKMWFVNGRPYSGDNFLNVAKNYSSNANILLDYLMPAAFIEADNTKLGQVYFGFTEGTGDMTQNVDIYGFAAEFIQ